MKAKKDHRVPLTQAALDVLAQVPRTGDLIFSGTKPGKPVSDMTMAAVLKRLNAVVGHDDEKLDPDTGKPVPIIATVHGFRSTFRDWAEERTGFDHRVKEAALAHTVSNRTEASYNRTDLLEKRIDLMTQWAEFATGGASSGHKKAHAVTA